jgi:hypothetical protein
VLVLKPYQTAPKKVLDDAIAAMPEVGDDE